MTHRNGFYAGRSVVVTGASGFIGSHLCEQLVLAGAHVTACSRHHRVDAVVPADSSAGTGRLEWMQADMRRIESVNAVLARARPSMVFHLAGIACAARGAELVLPTLHDNVLASINILTAALKTGLPKVVLAGSMEEPPSDGDVATSPYAMSKWAVGGYARMFHLLYELPITIGRMFMAYGPTRRDLHKVMPYMMLSLLADESPHLLSADREIDWIYVGDLADGLMSIAAHPDTIGQSLDIGSGDAISLRALSERVGTLIGTPVRPTFAERPERQHEQTRRADVARTAAVSGWSPQTSLDEGLRRTIAWFRAHRPLQAGALAAPGLGPDAGAEIFG
jgi:UDP-glucose 4-epimerase